MYQWHELLDVEGVVLREPDLRLDLLLRLLFYYYLFVGGEHTSVQSGRWTHGIVVFILIMIRIVLLSIYRILVIKIRQIRQLAIFSAGEAASAVFHLVGAAEVVSGGEGLTLLPSTEEFALKKGAHGIFIILTINILIAVAFID